MKDVGRQVLTLWQLAQLVAATGTCVADLPVAALPLWQVVQLVAAVKVLWSTLAPAQVAVADSAFTPAQVDQAVRGVLQAYLRAVDPGIKYAEPSIGRVATAPEVRGSGLGRLLIHEGLARCALQWPGQPVRISAQARLRAFYASLGFEAVGVEYVEDQILHLEMLRSVS